MISANKYKNIFKFRNYFVIPYVIVFSVTDQWLKPYGKKYREQAIYSPSNYLLITNGKHALKTDKSWPPHKPVMLWLDIMCLLMRSRGSYTYVVSLPEIFYLNLKHGNTFRQIMKV